MSNHHLEFLSLKGGYKARPRIHLSKYHIVGNHMSLLSEPFSYTLTLHNASSECSSMTVHMCMLVRVLL